MATCGDILQYPISWQLAVSANEQTLTSGHVWVVIGK